MSRARKGLMLLQARQRAWECCQSQRRTVHKARKLAHTAWRASELLAPQIGCGQPVHYWPALLPQPHPMANTIHASTNIPMPGTAQERHHLQALGGRSRCACH